MAKFRTADVNDFFSLTGGGVRRYHLEKLRFMAKREDVEYHLLLPSDRAGVEVFGSARVHHVPAVPVGTGYRMVLNPWRLRTVLRTIQPDIVEVGSPYNTPDYVRFALWGLDSQVVGFWHANYPVTDVGRGLGRLNRGLGRWGERAAWWWARRTYGQMAATLAATQCMVDQLQAAGVERVVYAPLGVDTQMFHPRHRDHALRASWGAGPDDVVVAWAGRLSAEKNYQGLLDAYELIRTTTPHKPVLVMAGHGPGLEAVQALQARYPEQVRYLGYIDQSREMARYLASVDVLAALSPYETFGLAAVEAMASGAALMGAAHMSIGEMLSACRCGIGLHSGSAREIADGWLELLRPGRAALLGARGRVECEQRYSWRATFSRIVQLYETVLAEAAQRKRPRLDALVPKLAGDGPDATEAWSSDDVEQRIRGTTQSISSRS